MTEFKGNKDERVEDLVTLFKAILKGENLVQLVSENKNLIDSCVPSDIISLVNILVLMNIPMTELKKGINKLLNLLHKTLAEFPYSPPEKEKYLGCLLENNRLLKEHLMKIKPQIREINKQPENIELKIALKRDFFEIKKFESLYIIKENVLFPVVEKYVAEFRCLKVMWSFHDDIRRNLKGAIEQLGAANFNLKVFNRQVGDLFFNINAIMFREERILYPFIQDVISNAELDSLFSESFEIGFPYYSPKLYENIPKKMVSSKNQIDLETGKLSVEQIKLLFNHLPVDITFVDENNKVKYFSSPKKRIFPRSKSVIGRDVNNCHPPESVHVVEQIVEAFRNGKKDVASFWINIKDERLLIQYFAIRDEIGNYKGVVEVSQDITQIQNLNGEKRLLDWEE